MTHRAYLVNKQGNAFNEKTACAITASLRDVDNAAVTPTTMRYRIDCLTTQQTVLDWTSVGSPAAENTLTVTSEQNAIIDANKRRETKQMIVETVYDGNTRNDAVNWTITNLLGVS